jgi:hypothetical protein
MDKVGYGILGFMWGILLMIAAHGLFLRPDIIEAGRIQVASGQYSCSLIEKQDKTTKWECKKNEN